MARPVAPASRVEFAQVSGNPVPNIPQAPNSSVGASAAIYGLRKQVDPQTDRNQIAKPWQIQAYRHINICGEARYAVTLFSAMAGRAEIGISQPNALARAAVWVTEGAEVDALAEIAPSVRDRSKLIRDYMLHRVIAGESYLIARKRLNTDLGYIPPPEGPDGEIYNNWEDYTRANVSAVDLMDPDYDPEDYGDPNSPIWEIVAVTEIQKTGNNVWKVRHDNNNYVELDPTDPVIRMWNPDPSDRREAWSPIRSLLPTLDEIEYLTKHIFTQVRSRLMGAGFWFLPDNLTFPPPPPDSIEGGEETIANLNEAEKFMLSMANAGMSLMEAGDVEFPNVIMSDPAALAAIDQSKLIKFWGEIDDKAMVLRADAVRRFALGMDLPPEQILGSSGQIVKGGGNGGGGSTNHWGVWANEEKTISAHIEPALDDFVLLLTVAVIQRVVEGTKLVVGYDTATLRLRQDRSKESIELYDRGELKGAVMLRENGFDPEHDMMDDKEFKRWLLTKIVGGSATPEQINEALKQLGVILAVDFTDPAAPGKDTPGPNQPRNLDDHPYEGPPREQHDHSPAPFSAQMASCEALVLRAMERAGNRLLNDRKRGKDRDRTTPLTAAHMVADIGKTFCADDFDFSLASNLLMGLTAAEMRDTVTKLGGFCADLYNGQDPYTREALIEAMS